jgi:hypothetical protein
VDAGHQPCKVEANKGAGFQPCKVQEQVELWVQDFNLAKLKQTRASNKQQTSEQAPRGPTAAAGPQLCKVEANNNKQHPRTNEQATTSEPVMSVENNIAQIHCRQDCIQKSEENVL